MRRPTVQGAARRTHSNKFQYHGGNRSFRRVSRTTLRRTERTIARTTRKSGECRRIRGRTYCPGAAFRPSIWGIPNKREAV
jgi:hypothetical protein